MWYEKNPHGLPDSYEAEEELFKDSGPMHSWIEGERVFVMYEPFFAAPPFEAPEAFLSLARLGARGEPSEAKITKWAAKFGLPSRTPNLETHEFKDEYGKSLSLKVGKGSMSIVTFREEVRRARLSLCLYAEIATRNVTAIKSRAADPKSWLDNELREEFRSLDYRTLMVSVKRGRMDEGEPEIFLSLRYLVEEVVAGYVQDVRTCPLVSFDSTTKSYSVTQLYKYPDLLSALYLQFLLLISDNTPMGYCEHPKCRTPFPAKPAHRRFCNDSCRSGARPAEGS